MNPKWKSKKSSVLAPDVDITVLGKRLIYVLTDEGEDVFYWEGTHDDTYCSIGEALGYYPKGKK